jgi:hypothetical protein
LPFVLLVACGSKGAVNFAIRAPSVSELNPFADARLSEYLLKTADGHVLAAASPSASSEPLALGPLPASGAPIDIEMSVLGGTELLGMARIRDVSIVRGVQNTYDADVRKPFVFVGAALPDEFDPMNHVQSSLVLDPSTARDVAGALAVETPPVKLPQSVSAATATSDGRFLLCGHARTASATPGLTVVDTGSAQTVGELPLSFAPFRVVTAPRDAAVALLDPTPPSGGLTLIGNVATLTTTPSLAQPVAVTLQGDSPRNAAFSADGSTLFVLDGNSADLDPCGLSPAPSANSLYAFDLGGNAIGKWTLPSFAGDLAVDAQSGDVLLSFPLMGSVGAIAAGTPPGAVSPRMLMTNSSCPSALHATAGELFVITAEAGGTPAAPTYRLKRVPLSGGSPDNFDFAQPQYQAQVNESDSPDGKIAFNLTVRPKYFYAYDLAVAPDASRIVFAARSHYSETPDQQFMLIDNFLCQPTLEIVEYGFFALDTRTGAASYVSRAQLVTSPAPNAPCISCDNHGGLLDIQIFFGCPSVPGDRPAGIAAIFGTP